MVSICGKFKIGARLGILGFWFRVCNDGKLGIGDLGFRWWDLESGVATNLGKLGLMPGRVPIRIWELD